jgi:DNA-directed RNA polymerase subunit RPC12/RpoP
MYHCVECGNPFESVYGGWQKYCSYACQKIMLLNKKHGKVSSDPLIRAHVFERDGKQCQYCGTSIVGTGVLEHIVPTRLNGPTEAYNLVVACVSCNKRKGSTIWIPHNLDSITIGYPEWRARILTEAVG